MPLTKKKCPSCFDVFETPWANAKFCASCRILRDKATNGCIAERECSCGKHYWPLRKNHIRCYECSDLQAGGRWDKPACTKCNQHNKMAYGLKDVCVACCQSTEKMRDWYMGQLALRRMVHRKNNGNSEMA